MRPNVAKSMLSVCFIGLPTAGGTGEIGPPRVEAGQNQTILFNIFPALEDIGLIHRSGTSNFTLMGVDRWQIKKVCLKSYNISGQDETIPNTTTFSSLTAHADSITSINMNSIIVDWDKKSQDSYELFSDKYSAVPLYLQCEWDHLSVSVKSTSRLFAIYDDDGSDRDNATEILTDLRDNNHVDITAPARDETTQKPNSSPSPTLGATTSSGMSSAATISATTSPDQALQTPQSGLSRGGVIGVAVGAAVAGLLVAGVLIWLLCIRRHKSATHHIMPNYGSEVGVHTIIRDKEIPAIVESSSPRSTYGGEGRPSTDHYAPYSDRSATSPAPHHHMTTSAAAAATSETDLNWNRGTPTPTSVIASRYAHLVEEGMTEDEIRGLEEEERQLDAAIENAGRGGKSRG